jgi:fucose 4-O-acetylase-like acetyltransferase
LPVAVLCTVPALLIPSMDMHTGLYPCYVLNLVVSVAACGLLWNVFYIAESSNFRALSFLAWAGRFSLLVLMVHYFEFMALFLYEKLSFLPGYAIVLIRVGVDLVVSFALSKVSFVRKFCIL